MRFIKYNKVYIYNQTFFILVINYNCFDWYNMITFLISRNCELLAIIAIMIKYNSVTHKPINRSVIQNN